MFVITMIIYAIGAVTFLIFGDCEIQSWAKNQNLKSENENENKSPDGETDKFIPLKE